MSRLPSVRPERGLLLRLAYRFAARRYGAVPEPVSVAAHHRGVFWTSSVHEMMAERAMNVLPPGVRDIAVYRAAVRLGCSWCVDFGTMLQRLSGLDIERLKEIDDYRDSPRYTDLERLAIAYADAMTDTPVSVTDEQVAELDDRFGHKGLVELTYVIAQENMRARSNIALGITDQGFASGDACRIRTEPA